jgi:hypothetical protein
MLLERLRKMDRNSRQTMIILAVGGIIVFQLWAMAFVAAGQVKQAELRESVLTSQRVAITQCLENRRGASLGSCMLQDSSSNPSKVAVARNTEVR